MTKYQNAKRILQNRESISTSNLRKLIIENMGADERTIQSYFKLMIEMKLIKDLGNFKWEVK